MREDVRYVESPQEFLAEAESQIRETDVVLDVGCGIVPQEFFRPRFRILMEPWQEYVDVLRFRYAEDPSVLVLRQLAQEGLRAFADGSVDTVFMLDLIEHMEKDVGRQVLVEAARVARQQVIVFTPYGFHANDAQDEQSGLDAWGLHGTEMQKHRSGWLPEDFPGWRRWVCQSFHRQTKNGVEERFGAMYAILTIKSEIPEKPCACPDIRRPTREEARLTEETRRLEGKCASLEAKLATVRASRSVRAVDFVRRAFGKRPLEI